MNKHKPHSAASFCCGRSRVLRACSCAAPQEPPWPSGGDLLPWSAVAQLLFRLVSRQGTRGSGARAPHALLPASQQQKARPICAATTCPRAALGSTHLLRAEAEADAHQQIPHATWPPIPQALVHGVLVATGTEWQHLCSCSEQVRAPQLFERRQRMTSVWCASLQARTHGDMFKCRSNGAAMGCWGATVDDLFGSVA